MHHLRRVLGVCIHANLSEPRLLCIIGLVTDSPEVTGSASNVPSSTSNQSIISSKTSSPVPSSSKSNSNAGAIAGGIVGGVVGVALIAGLVTWFTIRRWRRYAPSAEYFSGQGSDMGVVGYPMDIGTPKLYVCLFSAWPPAGVQDRD